MTGLVYFYLSKKIKLDFPCESLKHQLLFSLKNDEKIFMNVVCCSRDWRFRVKMLLYFFRIEQTVITCSVLDPSKPFHGDNHESCCGMLGMAAGCKVRVESRGN